jgi:hypothetical protein
VDSNFERKPERKSKENSRGPVFATFQANLREISERRFNKALLFAFNPSRRELGSKPICNERWKATFLEK